MSECGGHLGGEGAREQLSSQGAASPQEPSRLSDRSLGPFIKHLDLKDKLGISSARVTANVVHVKATDLGFHACLEVRRGGHDRKSELERDPPRHNLAQSRTTLPKDHYEFKDARERLFAVLKLHSYSIKKIKANDTTCFVISTARCDFPLGSAPAKNMLAPQLPASQSRHALIV
eukprot:2886344-Amphidinium_carterae.1